MNDYCIENDLVAQKEMAEMEIYGLQDDWRRMKTKLDEYREEFDEYKNAMEWKMGIDQVEKVLEEYRKIFN